MDQESLKFIQSIPSKRESKMLSVRIDKRTYDRIEAFLADHKEHNRSQVVEGMIKYCLDKFE